MAVMQASEASINFVKTRLASPDGKLWGKAPGMVLIKPISIAYSGTSATVGDNGQVTFDAVTSLSLNGCFTANFDNYSIVINSFAASGTNIGINFKLRSSLTDTSGSDYVFQYLEGVGTNVNAGRVTGLTAGRISQSSETLRSGSIAYIYGPYLTQPTALRSVIINGLSSAHLVEYACTHSLSNSYDGVTLQPASSTITGNLAVYGVRS